MIDMKLKLTQYVCARDFSSEAKIIQNNQLFIAINITDAIKIFDNLPIG